MDYLPVGCYGKVPCWREYLEYGVSFAAAKMLRRWLQDGFVAARVADDGSETGFVEGAERLLLFAPPEGSEWLAGVVGPSHDEQGRKRQFAVFTHLPKRKYAKAYHLLPMALAPTWAALADTRKQLMELLSRETFDDAILASQVPAPALPADSRVEYQRHLAGEVGALFQPPNGTSQSALVQQLPETFSKVKESRREPASVQFPVSTDGSIAAADASFWIDLINRQFRLRSFRPAVFLSAAADEAAPNVILSFGELPLESYRDIFGSEPGSAVLRPAGSADPPTAPDSSQAATYEGLLRQKF